MLKKNVDLGVPTRLSSWRKIAIGTWGSGGDPSVYGVLELEATPMLNYIEELKKKSGERITISHFVGKAVAETLKRHPDINCILRWGRLYPRKTVDIFFQVATDPEGRDLSGTTIRNADKKSVVEIAAEMHGHIKTIREKNDPAFAKMKNLMKLMPGFFTRVVLTLSGFLMYSLNLWSPLLGSPRDPFGSAMITNIGSLGLQMAFAPLVPYSRVPLLLALGSVEDQVRVVAGEIKVIPVLKICATFDHRLIDGVHAAHMSKTLRQIFHHPQRELHT